MEGAQNHHDDHYFCLIDITKFKGKKRTALAYPDIQSSIAPVPHSNEFPVLVLPSTREASLSESSAEENPCDEDFVQNIQPHFPNQQELNNLIWELGLTKLNAEILTSHFKECSAFCVGDNKIPLHSRYPALHQIVEAVILKICLWRIG